MVRIVSIFLLSVAAPLVAQIKDPAEPVQITVDRNRVVKTSNSTATLQTVVNPLLRRGSAIQLR